MTTTERRSPQKANPTEVRQPPHDLLAEQSVLGGMLLSKDAIADVIEKLRPPDFYKPAHETVYNAILDLYARGEPADPVTVAAELDRNQLLQRVGGAPYVHTLISTVPTAANASFYAGIVAEKALLRRLVAAGTRVVQYGYAGADGADVNDVVDRAQAEIYDVTERRGSDDITALEDLLQPTLDDLDTIAAHGGLAQGVPTGFPDIDAITNGLHPGQMIIIAARPGVGKALALDTPLPTPAGWTTMADVRVGDELLDASGAPTTVVAATDIMRGRPCFAVAFDDHTKIVADAQHQWPTGAGVLTTTEIWRTLNTRAGAVWLTPSAQVAHHWRTGGGTQEHAGAPQGADSGSELAPDDDTHPRTRPDLTLNPPRPGYWRTTGSARHRIVAVTPTASVPVRCVQVDNPAHLYLAGAGRVPTHNSTLALDFMRSCSIKHRQPSVIFSLEMSKPEIVMRLLSAEASVKLGDMRSGRMSDDDWTRMARRMSEISEAPLYIDDSPNLTMMEIRAKARRLRQRVDLKLVVVDYLQLMSSGKKYESRQQEVSDFSRSLKLLAKELDVPVIAVSQLNRGPEQRAEKTPQVSDLRESGSLEQDSDMIFLLHRPDASERDHPRGGEADVILGKHRNGPTATITVAHQLHLSRFAPMAHMGYK